MAMGKHYGSFGKGFADALIAMIKMSYMRDYYQSRSAYYKSRAASYGQPKPGSKAALDAEGRAAATDAEGRPLSPYALHGGAGDTDATGGAARSSNPFLARLMGLESGGQNIVSHTDRDSHGLTLAQGGNPDEISQGYFQIQNHPGGTWATYAKAAGVDIKQYPTPRSAPYEVQLSVANGIPLEQWGGRTKIYMRQAFGDVDMRRPLGELAAAHGPVETATTPKTEKTRYGGPDAKTSTGATVHTDAEGRAIDPKTGKPTQAQADTLPTNQVAGGTDEEAMRIALEENQKLKEQQDHDSPMPPPGPDAPMPKRSLPLDQQTQPRPAPPDPRERVSAIPPGPTVPAQTDRPQQVPPESGFPLEYPLHAERPDAPPVGGLPAPAGARPDAPSGGGLPLGPVGARPEGPPVGGLPAPAGARPDAPYQPTGPIDPSIIARQRLAQPLPQMGPEGGGRTTLPPEATPQMDPEGPGRTAIPSTPTADVPARSAQPVSSAAPPRAAAPVTPASNSPFVGIDRPNTGPNERNRGSPQGTALDLSHLFGPNPPLAKSAPPGGTQTPVPSGQILSNGPTPYPGGGDLNPSGRLALRGGNASGPDDTRSAPTPMPPPKPAVMGGAGAPTPPIRPDDLDLASASAKGGPIQRFSKGGIPSRPTVKLAGGGNPGSFGAGNGAPNDATMAAAYNNSGQVPANWYAQPAYQNGPAYTDRTALQNQMSTLLYPSGGAPANLFTSPAHISTPAEQSAWGALTPDQQTWYQNAGSALSSANTQPLALQDLIYKGVGAPPATPAAAAPAPAAPAPAAPAPVAPTVQNIVTPVADTTTTDPSTTTSTGIPKVPTNAAIAKSYDPNVDAVTGAGFTNTSNAGGTNYSVGTDDRLNTTSDNTISGVQPPAAAPVDPLQTKLDAARAKLNANIPGQTILSRKGGPIQRFNKGGIPSRPTMKYATGGTTGMSVLNAPGYIGPTLQGGWSGSTAYGALAPNQQAWADATKNVLSQELTAAHADAAYWGSGGKDPNGPNPTMQYWNQVTAMPDAIWPTAPAAPAPTAQPAPTVTNITPSTVTDTPTPTSGIPNVPNVVTTVDTPAPTNTTNTQAPAPTPAPIIDPTSTTTTAAPSKPLYKTPHSLDPNDTSGGNTGGQKAGEGDWGNVGGTNYAIGSNNFQAQNSPVQIAGFQRGGGVRRAPPRKDYTRQAQQKVPTRYDDGGGVSPSFVGMPPALGGGQQQVPPYYFNPATYSGAGAPVGKGVTNTSAPTYVGGAIPTLPMALGGRVTKFDDGGAAEPDESASMMPSPIMDEMQDQRDDAEDAQRAQADAAYTASPGAGAGAYDQGGKYFAPPEEPVTPASNQGGQGQGHGPYQRTDNLTPQIKDDQGNPSRGLIDALSGGIQWIASHVGIGSAQAAGAGIANDPQTQTARQNFAQGRQPDGDAVISHAAYHEGSDVQDPGNALNKTEHHIAGMEGMRLWMLNRGDIVGANKMAASQMQYTAAVNAPLGEEAAKRYYDGNLKGALDALNEADSNMVDGRHITFQMSSDGKSIFAVGQDLNARDIWKQQIAPHAILAAALGYRDQSATWKRYEDMAVRYDPAMKAEYDARIAEQKQSRKEAAATEKTAASEAALGPTDRPYTGGANASAPAAPAAPQSPALTPVSTEPQPSSPYASPAIPADAGPPPGPAAPAAPSPGKSPDSTTAQQASPPPSADSNRNPALAARGTGAAQNVSAPDAQEAAADTDFKTLAASLDKQEEDGHARIRQKWVTPDGNPVLGGKEILPADPNHPHDAAWVARDARWREAMQTVNGNIKSEDSDLTVRIAAQKDAAAKAYAAGKEFRGRAHSDAAAATLETNKEKAATTLSDRQERHQRGAKDYEWTHTEQQPLTPNETYDRFKETPPAGFLAASPFTAANKGDGTLDPKASAQALGQMFDLNDRGGIRRVDTLSTALGNIQTFNKHMLQQPLGTMVVGMANGTYGYRAKPQPVDYGQGPLYQVEVYHGKVGQGAPVRLLVPVADYDAIEGVKGEYVEAHKTAPTTDGASLPPPPAPAAPSTAPTTVRPVTPLIQSQPGLPPRPVQPRSLQLPTRVPNEQVPPDWKTQFPELNQ